MEYVARVSMVHARNKPVFEWLVTYVSDTRSASRLFVDAARADCVWALEYMIAIHDVKQFNYDKNFALMEAACSGCMNSARWLLTHGGCSLAQLGGLATLAATNNHVDAAQWFLEQGDTGPRDDYSLAEAVNSALTQRHIDGAMWLVDNGVIVSDSMRKSLGERIRECVFLDPTMKTMR